MLLYCPKCQNLIDKTKDNKSDGELIVRDCNKCGSTVSFYVKYKAVSSIIRKEIDLTQ